MRNDLRALIVCIGLIAGMLAVPGGVHAKSYGPGSPEQEIAEQIEIINSEITSETPNRLAIQQALLIVRTRGNHEFEPALHELRSMLKQKRLSISKIERRGELYNEFDKAIAAVRNRIEVRSAADVKKDEASPTAQSRPTYFRDYLLKAKDDPRAKQGHQIHEKIPTIPEEYLLVVLSGILTDDIRLGRAAGKPQVLSGRDLEAQKVMDVLVRSKARNPVLVGSAGVGKTSVARIVAEDILDGHYPHTDVYLSELENAEIIVTTPSRMSQMALSNEPTAQAAAVEQFFDAVRAVEQNYLNKTGVKKNLIVFIDDMHALDPPQINALKQVIENEQHPVRIIGASLNEALELKLKKASGIKKLLEIIPVQEFSVEQTLNLLKGTWAPEFLEKYNVKFTEKALSVLLTVSAYIRPGLARPEGPFMVMQEVAVKAHRDQEGQLVEIDDDYIYEYVRKVTGIPTNPHKADEFDGYLKNLRSTLSARVANQQNMIDALVDVWSQVLTGNPQIPKSVLLTGPTGTGKTLLAEN
ncbi:MAG: ATP-dependent Clp protease ATP-binding subunit, partial [Bdellovibrionales bacterium]|nr:ATP-dependent Clp protease ATP-binding subunit [Bdellovibrionales bacterium]